jgi:hypothetical protein
MMLHLFRPHPKSLSQSWERDFEDFNDLLPFSQNWEKGLGDEGEHTDGQSDKLLPSNLI